MKPEDEKWGVAYEIADGGGRENYVQRGPYGTGERFGPILEGDAEELAARLEQREELLEALKDCVSLLDAMSSLSVGDAWEMVAAQVLEANAAIAKAEGK